MQRIKIINLNKNGKSYPSSNLKNGKTSEITNPMKQNKKILVELHLTSKYLSDQ
tara:strand:- start:57 stop:218 length:162 start_codon:yes stop_codon:yes gene_type:complete